MLVSPTSVQLLPGCEGNDTYLNRKLNIYITWFLQLDYAWKQLLVKQVNSAYIINKIFGLCICESVSSCTSTFYSLKIQCVHWTVGWRQVWHELSDRAQLDYVLSMNAQQQYLLIIRLMKSVVHLPEHGDLLLIQPYIYAHVKGWGNPSNLQDDL